MRSWGINNCADLPINQKPNRTKIIENISQVIPFAIPSNHEICAIFISIQSGKIEDYPFPGAVFGCFWTVMRFCGNTELWILREKVRWFSSAPQNLSAKYRLIRLNIQNCDFFPAKAGSAGDDWDSMGAFESWLFLGYSSEILQFSERDDKKLIFRIRVRFRMLSILAHDDQNFQIPVFVGGSEHYISAHKSGTWRSRASEISA
jgi:hypothetical protein